MFVSVPLFSLRAVPARVRLILSLAITLVVMPVLPTYPMVEMFSYQGFLVAVAAGNDWLDQWLYCAVGFCGTPVCRPGRRIKHGLGFASMVDPQNGQQVPVIAQFYVMASTLVFLSLDGHLVLIKCCWTALPACR